MSGCENCGYVLGVKRTWYKAPGWRVAESRRLCRACRGEPRPAPKRSAPTPRGKRPQHPCPVETCANRSHAAGICDDCRRLLLCHAARYKDQPPRKGTKTYQALIYVRVDRLRGMKCGALLERKRRALGLLL